MSSPPREVPRVERLSAAEYERDFVSPERPVVVAGGARGWPAAGWTADHLKQVLAGRTIKVASSEEDVFGYDEAEAAYIIEELDFSAAADLIVRRTPSRRRYYLMQQHIAREFPELAADVPVPEYAGRAQVHPHLWFGSEGNLTPLHFDMANNAFAQIQGRKRFLLFEPAQSAWLYPRPAGSKHYNLSQIDPARADLERFPDFARTLPWQCEVGPGDLLLLPAQWWHQVRSLEAGISVSVWWGMRPEQFRGPMARRMLPVFYVRDRLLSFKATVSEAGEHSGFLGMARFMCARRDAAPAVLFAAAALEESVRLLYMRAVKPADPASLRDPARMASALHEAAAVSADEAAGLREWASLLARVLAGPEAEIGQQEAERLVEGVASFLAAHPVISIRSSR